MRYALLALAVAALPAQELVFNSLPVGPSARFDGTIAYDPPANQLFLFGGQDTTARNDLWAYSVDSRTWRALSPPSPLPDARFGHTLTYDPVRRRLILFGGQAGAFFSDLWAYDIAANQWTQLAANGAGPSRRYGHSAIYDTARARLVISHGFTDRGRFDDTWAFDLATNRWSDISPSNRPLRRCLHHAVYDAAGDQMFLYGGCASGFGPCPLGDLWSFNLRTGQWTEIRGTITPPPRQHYGFAFDDTRRRALLFGGSGSNTLNDTWEFDPATQSWTQLAIPNSPTPRLRHQGVYAAAPADAVFFFGGITTTATTAELLSLAPVRPAIVNAFSQAPGPFAPGTLITAYGANLAVPAGFPVLYASPTQVNLRVPESTPTGRTDIFNTSIAIVDRAPGIFPIAFRTQNTLTLFVTGANESVPAPVTLQIDGTAAELSYAGAAPGLLGVMQINATISPTAPSAVSVTLRIGSAETTGILKLYDTP